jgi:hypothetical protein
MVISMDQGYPGHAESGSFLAAGKCRGKYMARITLGISIIARRSHDLRLG